MRRTVAWYLINTVFLLLELRLCATIIISVTLRQGGVWQQSLRVTISHGATPLRSQSGASIGVFLWVGDMGELVILLDDGTDDRRHVRKLVTSIGLMFQCYDRPLKFLNEFSHDGPGVIVSELIMPEMTGVELLRAARARKIFLPFVVGTGHADVEASVWAFREGAFDLLEKPFCASTFIAVIQRAIDHSRSELALHQQQQNSIRLLKRLTSREGAVIRGIFEGASNKQIARALSISHRTVEHHRQCAFKKLAVQSVLELALLLMRADPGSALGVNSGSSYQTPGPATPDAANRSSRRLFDLGAWINSESANLAA